MATDYFMLEDNNVDKIKRAILEMIAFFDMFDYPLSLFELWFLSSVKCRLSDVNDALDALKSKGIIKEKNGFYFLPERGQIVDIRSRRYAVSFRKFKRARRIVKIFKFIPWIKMVAVGNLLGANNLKDGGDIDLFIITDKKRLFLSRFFCVAITEILRLRPRPENTRDKICLSFLISEQAMDLRKLMIGPQINSAKANKAPNHKQKSDVYFLYWLVFLMPIYNLSNIYYKFIKANSWTKKFFPNWQLADISQKRIIKPLGSYFYGNIFDLFFGGLESAAKKLEIKMLPKELRALMNKDTRVVINSQVLKLHTNDRREYYRQKFKDKISLIEQKA